MDMGVRAERVYVYIILSSIQVDDEDMRVRAERVHFI
jgi:hypothetical protein